MKYLLLILIGVSFMAQSQINYTVKVTKLKALADACDGEFVGAMAQFFVIHPVHQSNLHRLRAQRFLNLRDV